MLSTTKLVKETLMKSRAVKTGNPVRPTTGWRVKRVGLRVHLMKKNIIFLFFLSQNYIIILIKI